MATCVFCNHPIPPDEAITGRPPMAAHAACADAALADDRHWDAIAARAGDAGEGNEYEAAGRGSAGPAAGSARGRAGCMALAVVIALGVALARARR